MARPQLRLYAGPSDETTVLTKSDHVRECVSVPLGEILPVLADALRARRTWVRDFEDEEVTISTDLYQVILAYQHYRRPSA